MQATPDQAFIAEWRNYLAKLGFVISWDADSEMQSQKMMPIALNTDPWQSHGSNREASRCDRRSAFQQPT